MPGSAQTLLGRLWLPAIAFAVNAAATFSMAALSSAFSQVPILVAALLYAMVLIAVLTWLLRSAESSAAALGARAAAVHAVVSLILFAVANGAGDMVPVVGGGLSFASALFFFMLNLPGVRIAKLLPYSGNPSGLSVMLHCAVSLSATAAWLFLAVVAARVSSTRPWRARNAA